MPHENDLTTVFFRSEEGFFAKESF